MLKRLNFLKTSLDGHSPKETTNALRLKAIKKRDEADAEFEAARVLCRQLEQQEAAKNANIITQTMTI